MNTTPKTPLAIPTVKLDEWAALTQTAPTVDPEDLRPGDRFRAVHEYRVDLEAQLGKATELIERLEKAVRTLKQIQGGGDRIRGKIEGVNLALSYAREHLPASFRGNWQPVAESRYELLSHDDDPRVAVVREWLSVVPLDSDAGDEGLARDLITKLDAVRAYA